MLENGLVAKDDIGKNLPTSNGSLVVRATSDLCIGELSYLLEEVFTKLSLLGGSLVALASFVIFSTLAEFSSSDLFVRFSLSILFPIKKALFQLNSSFTVEHLQKKYM